MSLVCSLFNYFIFWIVLQNYCRFHNLLINVVNKLQDCSVWFLSSTERMNQNIIMFKRETHSQNIQLKWQKETQCVNMYYKILNYIKQKVRSQKNNLYENTVSNTHTLHCTRKEEGKYLSKQGIRLMNGRLCSTFLFREKKNRTNLSN